jgi:multiple sugar transport system permease protein
MMRPSKWTRALLHLANLAAIAFFLLPLIAVAFGALQSERSLHADTRALWPPEWTLDNFRVIISQGAQRGKVFEQATYLPDNIKKFHFALINSTVISISVTVLTLISNRLESAGADNCARAAAGVQFLAPAGD